NSVIVPTYKECNNLKPLTERLFNSLQKYNLDKSTELIIVDDNSNDGSKELIDQLSKYYNVKILVRTKERGLSSAVLHGFSNANASEVLICMDADLQHPPEKVVELIKSLKENEFVIGTRYAGGNSIDKDWPVHRRVISSGARLLVVPLKPMKKQISGFFGIQKKILQKTGIKKINPIGFKICLEVYVKCNIKKHAEVPIVFGVRTEGESKLSSKVIVNYLKHLFELYTYQMPLALV
ncbi:dolichol-P-mannose synthesis, partial [Clydaea vesicula]